MRETCTCTPYITQFDMSQDSHLTALYTKNGAEAQNNDPIDLDEVEHYLTSLTTEGTCQQLVTMLTDSI